MKLLDFMQENPILTVILLWVMFSGIIDIIKAFRSGAQAVKDWQPIDSAPKDGTKVLLLWHDGVTHPMYDVGFNLGDGRRWQDNHQWLHNEHSWPTHWMSLPSDLPDPPETTRTS